MTRLRVIPAPENTKYHKAAKYWQHVPPREQEHLFGGFCSIMCIGERNGCIFHEDHFKWKSSSKIPINVIEYEMDKTQRLTGNKAVKLWIIGPRIYDQIKGQMALNSIEEISSVDIFLKRIGSKQTTSYSVSIAPNCVEQQIDWNLPPIGEFGDETYPFLIDFNKTYGFEEMSPDEQRAWLNERMEKGRAKAAAGTEPSDAPSYSAPQLHTPPTLGATGGNFALGSLPSFGAAIGAYDDMARTPNYAAIEAKPDPWNMGLTFGQLTPDQLTYILNTPGHSADQVKDANALLNRPVAPPPPPPAAAVAPPPPPSIPAPPPMAAPAAPAPQLAPASFPNPAPFPSAAPAPAPAAAFPSPPAAPVTAAPAFPAPPAAPAINPARQHVETQLQQNTAVFAHHDNVKRFMGVWGVRAMSAATDEILAQMTAALAQPNDQLLAWVTSFPVPNWD